MNKYTQLDLFNDIEENDKLMLFDRVEMIKATNQKYDLEHNAYLSFSGGKDSTILHYLLDMALPNNKIPRVFIDTGIEYNLIRQFVKELAENDDRFVLVKPTKSIKKVLETYGYPFKSKEHSFNLSVYQRNGLTLTNEKYLGMTEKQRFLCPKCLRYQFTPEFDIKISNKCCLKLKKEPAKEWAKANNKSILLTGMRASEGGLRATNKNKGCAILENNKLIKFHPLMVVTDEWEDWFIKENNIKLCALYYEPYNFNRTGCKGCPFAIDLQEQLDKMEQYLPTERKQCEIIWKPIYDEYRRINYRLKKELER